MRLFGVSGALLVALGLGLGGCESNDLETRTYRLDHLDAARAAQLLEPYVSAVEGGSMSVVEGEVLTIRQTETALDRIGEILDEFDQPEPVLTLRFRIIEADGFETDETELADVLPTLREVLRFDGYQMLGEAQSVASAYGGLQQVIATSQEYFLIHASVGAIRVVGDGGSVQLQVELHERGRGSPIFTTEVAAPIGRTVILGTSKPASERGAYILTVEPTYVRP